MIITGKIHLCINLISVIKDISNIHIRNSLTNQASISYVFLYVLTILYLRHLFFKINNYYIYYALDMKIVTHISKINVPSK